MKPYGFPRPMTPKELYRNRPALRLANRGLAAALRMFVAALFLVMQSLQLQAGIPHERMSGDPSASTVQPTHPGVSVAHDDENPDSCILCQLCPLRESSAPVQFAGGELAERPGGFAAVMIFRTAQLPAGLPSRYQMNTRAPPRQNTGPVVLSNTSSCTEPAIEKKPRDIRRLQWL
jgi:hypothetical protein